MASKLDEIIRPHAHAYRRPRRQPISAPLSCAPPLTSHAAFAAGSKSREIWPCDHCRVEESFPVKGLIRAEFPVADLAHELEQAGASALSVLTDEPYFQGSLRNLELASQATSLPCLRKDFIVDEFQLLEARAHCADAVLLIVAALTQSELTDLSRRARTLELDVLCEVHDRDELQRALDAGCDTIGVNNRNLHTFRVDLNTSLDLAELMPGRLLKVAESGIETADDIARLRAAGFGAFLIGESLMRASSSGRCAGDSADTCGGYRMTGLGSRSAEPRIWRMRTWRSAPEPMRWDSSSPPAHGRSSRNQLAKSSQPCR